MKIVGWEIKGNVVRFAFGEDDLDYWGSDNWEVAPYEHNALTVPMFGTKFFVDIAFRYETSVLEAQDDWHYGGNSPFCMDDFKERKVPILVIDVTGNESFYSECVNKEEVFGIFMGDRFEDINWRDLGRIMI